MQYILVTPPRVEVVEQQLEASEGVGEGARDDDEPPPLLRGGGGGMVVRSGVDAVERPPALPACIFSLLSQVFSTSQQPG